MVDYIRSNGSEAVFHYMMGCGDDDRRHAVSTYSKQSGLLIERLESDRKQIADESFAVRNRVHRARLFLEFQELIIRTAISCGANPGSFTYLKSSFVKGSIRNIPILNVEAELASRLEDQQHNINENDLRDFSTFSAVIPLADIIVGEKQFINLARQAGLDKLYGKSLLCTISDIGDFL